jgi:ketosteroid isomerase-like protein
MPSPSHIDSFTAYLQAYADKDLARVASMLADDVTLRDWEVCVVGKTAALAETRKNFDAVATLTIKTLSVFEGDHSVAGELHICVDGHIDLFVVDVLTFNIQGQISAVRAYKGRGEA